MNKLPKIKQKIQKKQREKMLRNWLASLVTTVSVVVVVIVLIPASAIATFHSVKSFQHEVSFSLLVTDQDDSIIEGSLVLKLQNQMELYEQELSVGLNSGIFTNLQPNTTYKLSVFADKGFGQEVLAYQMIKTLDQLNGAIINIEQIVLDNPYSLLYSIETFYSDPNEELQDIYISYGYKYPQEQDIQYMPQLPVSSLSQTHELINIPNYNCDVVVFLYGVRHNDEIIVLDEYHFKTPLVLQSMFEVSQLTTNSLKLQVYADYIAVPDIEYTIQLWHNNRIVQTKPVPAFSETMHHDTPDMEFINLYKNTEYTIKMIAHYIDPITLTMANSTIQSETIVTLGDFTVEYTIEEFDEYYEVSITLIDPNHLFQLGVFWYYDTSEEYEYLIAYQLYGFTPSGNSKTTTFIIDKEPITTYRIEIGIQSETISYQYIIVEEIIGNE